MNNLRLAAFGLLVAAVSACNLGFSSSGSSAGCMASVSGTVTFEQAVDLPEDAVVTIQIQDTSLQDVAATVIGEQAIVGPAQAPITYKVCYDADEIDDRLTYGMSVRITDGNGKLLAVNDTHTPVITKGNPKENVEVQVIRVGG